MPLSISTDKAVYKAGDDIIVTVSADDVGPVVQAAKVVAKRIVDGVEERAEQEIQIEYPVSVSTTSVFALLGWDATDPAFTLSPTETPGQYQGRVNTRL